MTGQLDAAAYDGWFDQPWGRYAFTVERAALLDAVGPLVGRRVLDVGCGTGRFTRAFEQAGAEVTGLDADAGMLDLAHERVEGDLVAGDAHRLPVEANAVDVAVAITLLEFVDEPRAVVDELVRVTRPGGRVVLAALNRASPWGVAHVRELRGPAWSAARLLSPRQLRGLLADHGRLTTRAALYAPGAIPGLSMVGPMCEAAGRLVPAAGAFQIVVAHLPYGDDMTPPPPPSQERPAHHVDGGTLGCAQLLMLLRDHVRTLPARSLVTVTSESLIVDELAGRVPTATFDGHGACFLEVGGGSAAYATGDFYAPQGPDLELRPPARRWHLAKVGLERYWLTRWWW